MRSINNIPKTLQLLIFTCITINIGYRFQITKRTYDVDPIYQHETTPSFRIEAEEVKIDLFNNNYYENKF